jgi:hypothetical protein
MSHCIACDKNLSDFEATRKIIHDDGKIEYPDLCNKCFKESELEGQVTIVERSDLSHEIDISDDEMDSDPMIFDSYRNE